MRTKKLLVVLAFLSTLFVGGFAAASFNGLKFDQIGSGGLGEFLFGDATSVPSQAPATTTVARTTQPKNTTPSNNETATFLSVSIKSMSIPGILKNDQNGNLIGGQKISLNDIDGLSALIANSNIPTSIVGDTNIKGTIENSVLKFAWDGILPVSRGGTGLTTFGKPGQILAVNAAGTGLEFRNADGTLPPVLGGGSSSSSAPTLISGNLPAVDPATDGVVLRWDSTLGATGNWSYGPGLIVDAAGNITTVGTVDGIDLSAKALVWDTALTAETDPIYSAWNKSTGISINESQISDLQAYLTFEADPVFLAWDKSTGISITESQISDLKAYLTAELDPIFLAWNKSTGISITESQISDLKAYLLAELDPVFLAWDKSTGISITESQISDLKAYLTAELDPIFTAWDKSTGISITESQISDLKAYLLAELDPVFTAWDKSTGISITEGQISDLQAYLLVEADPVFLAWDKSTGISITESQISDLKAYLTAELDPIFLAWNKSTGISITESQISDLKAYLLAELDPVFLAWDKSTGISITESQISDLKAYLTAELDPIFLAWNKSTGISITESQISDLQAYLLAELDPVFLAWDKSTGISITESQISDLQAYATTGSTPIFAGLVFTPSLAPGAPTLGQSYYDSGDNTLKYWDGAWKTISTNPLAEADPVFLAWDKSTGISITESQISDLKAYLTAELDPIFLAWNKSTGISITESQISDLQAYLLAELDPIFTAWDKSTGISITESQISDLQAYLTAELDPIFTAWNKSTGISITESQISDLQAYLLAELDPIFTAWDKSTGISITESQISDLQAYLLVEADPVFLAWDKSTGISITESQISDLQAYLLAETDPIYSAWDKSTGISITESQISDLQAYLTAESDPVYLAWDKSTGISITESQISDLQAYLTAEVDPIYSAWDKTTGITIDSTQVSDFDTAVSANTDVAANTAARHDILTIGTANGLILDPTQILSMDLASAATTGALSNTDWSDFDAKQDALSFGNVTTTTTGLTIAGAGQVVGGGLTVNLQNATANQNGLLTLVDWNTFNNKQGALTAGNSISLAANIINTIQNIRTIDSPTFAGLTLNGNLITSGNVDGIDVSAKAVVWDTAKSKLDLLTYTAEGTGGGLDSDTVDGKHAADFLSATGGTVGGQLNVAVGDGNSTVLNGLTVTRTNTAGNGTANMGTAIRFDLENEAGTNQTAGEAATYWTNLLSSSKSSAISFSTWQAGWYQEALRIDGGVLKVPGAYTTAVAANPAPRALYVDATGKIGYVQSSERYKNSITNMEDITWLYALQPVNYVYNEDAAGIKQYGLIAEDVANINSLFVSYNEAGTPETVNYNSFIPVLIKAAQDQNNQIEGLATTTDELGLKLTETSTSLETALTTIAEQQNQIDALKNDIQNLNNAVSNVASSAAAANASVAAIPEITTSSSDEDVINLTNALNALTGEVNAIKIDVASFKNAIAINALTGDASFASHILVNADTANTAVIAQNTNKIEVTFAKAYASAPIVNATPLDFIIGQYKISNVTVNGFTIETSEAQTADVGFNWTALGRS